MRKMKSPCSKAVRWLVELEIHEVLHRPSFETHAYWNRDIFLRVSANLTSPQSQEVVYQLGVILRGKTLDAKWLKDVDDWCRTKIVRQPNPFISQNDEPCYLIDELPAKLMPGVKVDGWLHFRTNCDKPEGSIPILPGDWKIIRKQDAVGYEGCTLQKPLPPPV